MPKQELLQKLKDAIMELREEDVNRLLKEGLEVGLSPMEMITDGLNPGLSIIGEGFAKAERFMSELMIAGDIMTNAMELLRPAMEKGGKATGDVMVIGSVQGDLHTIGKKIVCAIFTGAGYRVVDIGEDQPASEFVKAAKELKACVVGASCTLSPTQPYCKTINDALVDAGIRDHVVFAIGGWRMTQATTDSFGADCFGDTAVDGLHKVQAIRSGEMKKLKHRKK